MRREKKIRNGGEERRIEDNGRKEKGRERKSG